MFRILTWAASESQHSQEDYVSAPTVTRNLTLMKRGDDAFNARDIEAMAAVHHPEAFCHVTGSAEPTTTLPPHMRAVEQMIEAFPDVRVHNDPYPIQFRGGDWVTVISKVTGTFTGRMSAPDGTVINPTGKSFEVNFSTTCRWDEAGQLVEEYVFWDSALLAQQIGLGA
jgi:hypothetical protein